MKNKQILESIAELVGIKFGNNREVKFAMVELEGGFIVSNQKDDDFVVGDTIYVVNEDGTYSVVGADDWTYLDGSKSLKTDEEGTLTEISSNEPTEAGTEEEMEEVSVDVPEEVSDVVDANIVENIVEALTPIIEEIKVLQEELMNFKKDYQKFKESATHTPLKEDKIVSKAFSSDSRYEVLKAMKEARKK
jgi:uncharacterized protein YktA (UPF0223 family)